MGYIQTMVGTLQRARGYSSTEFELRVTVAFDAKQFNQFKKNKKCPIQMGMAQIKNVVFDATGVRGTPSYARASYTQKYPRASKGLVTLDINFLVSAHQAAELSGLDIKPWTTFFCAVGLQKTLEATRNESHLFAKTVIASRFGD